MQLEDYFICHDLDSVHTFYTGVLPEHLRLETEEFEMLWNLHPDDFHTISMFGRTIPTPRWQQAYGVSYEYSGNLNKALPIPAMLQPYLDWSQQVIDTNLNALLLNWYDGQRKHYIGAHHDSVHNMIENAPIVTVSFGEQRLFKILDPDTKTVHEFFAQDSSVFVMPYDTNIIWKHAVPHKAKNGGRRISVTIRALFEPE